ncbi:LysR family transcriptional regulator [Pseudomonas alkylphenolica]|nr:LysR family transcriptional regulator [Pseudomonas alkylphenolica]
MNTRQLQHFLALMETGSLSAAADAVHLSQPALSRSIKALEDELRVSLFDRTNRRLHPTPYAMEYLGRAKRIVFDEREGARTLNLMKNGAYGPLSFGLGSSVAIDFLGALIQQLLAVGPGLKIQAQVHSTDVLLDALQKEKLDFFIGDVGAAATYPELAVEPLYKCSFGWFARADHPLAGRKGVTIEDLREHPLIGSGYISEMLTLKMAHLYGMQLPIENNFAASINNIETVHNLVVNTNAIVPTTFLAMLKLLREGRVAIIDVQPPFELDLTLGIVTIRHRTQVPAAEQSFAIIRAYFEAVQQEIETYR